MSKKPFLPPRWVIRLAWKIHRALYRLSFGRFGLRTSKPDTYGLMWVTTIGRRSGLERNVMLGFFEDGDNLVTMAMNGWGAAEPAWWLNMQAEPEVWVDLVEGRQRFSGRAAVGEERELLWRRWAHLDKNLDEYASLRPNETAVVILEPIADPETKR